MAVIRRCTEKDFLEIYAVINEAARAFRGVIPADRWNEPYMTEKELRAEMDDGIQFYAYEQDGAILGVMGIQSVKDVSLIRHAYVLSGKQGKGIGGRLMSSLRGQTERPVLLGTWADAHWAIRFYEGHGFRRVPAPEKDGLLRKYWHVSERQIETSVVLADGKWFALRGVEGSRQ